MIDKILYLILGVLVGAIITSLIFIFVLNKNGRPQGFDRNFERRERPENMGNFVMPEGGKMPKMGEGKMPNGGGMNMPSGMRMPGM